MTLSQHQRKFARLLPYLIDYIYTSGYEVTIGEVFRPPETAALYAKQGRGSARSLHTLKLAVDLNLFFNGRYLQSWRDHEPFGLFWEDLDKECRWGGRFKSRDGNHYSLAWKGRA